MKTSEIPAYSTGDIQFVITLVEIEPGVKRLRLTPESDFRGPAGNDGMPGVGIPGADGAPGANGVNGTNGVNGANGTNGVDAAFQLGVALSDETTDLTTGTAKVTFRMPGNVTLTTVRANINTVSSAGLVTVDINQTGVTILSTKITIDVGEKTSTTAVTPPVISTSALTDDAEITMDIDVAGTGAKGLKIWLIGIFA